MKRGFLLIFVLVLLSCVSAAPRVIPVFRSPATASCYESGESLGKQSAALVAGWFASAEMSALFSFVDGPGKSAFEELKVVNGKAFPCLANMISGIAAGAGVHVDKIWTANLLQELENLMRQKTGKGPFTSGHCSDVFGANGTHLSWGHNEDWSVYVEPYAYISVQPGVDGGEFRSCAGFCYPGMIPGSALSFNAEGIVYTQNALFPTNSRNTGLASNFVNRQACESSSLKELVESQSVKGQAMGFSLNANSILEKAAVQLEVYEDTISVYDIPAVGNYSHFNMYKRLSVSQHSDPPAITSSLHRQARMDQLPPVRTYMDVVNRLGDTSDKDWPIYRVITIMTSVVDVGSGTLTIWSGVNPSQSPPLYVWDLNTFWMD